MKSNFHERIGSGTHFEKKIVNGVIGHLLEHSAKNGERKKNGREGLGEKVSEFLSLSTTLFTFFSPSGFCSLFITSLC